MSVQSLKILFGKGRYVTIRIKVMIEDFRLMEVITLELKKLTNKNLVCSHAQAKTKDEAIKLLVKKLYEEGKVSSYEGYLEVVYAREALSPTGFEAGLAIPHGKSEYVKEASFAVMTVEEPIKDWESIDPTNEVQLVFLIAVPESEGGSTHITVLSELVKRLSVDAYKKALLESKTAEELYNNIDMEEKKVEEPKEETEASTHANAKTVLAITACPAGIAHTYMAAEALLKAGKEMGVNIYVEKQGANGIVDPHTKELIEKADVIIYATDVAPKNTERFEHLPNIKTKVAAPLREAKQIIERALEVAEKQGKGEYIASNDEEEGQAKSKLGSELKAALLTGVSHMTPLIVAGGMVLTLAILLAQGFGLQEVYAQEGSWLWMIRQLGNGMVGTLLMPVFAAYMAFSIGEKPALAPGFAAGLAANMIGSGFLGGIVGGIIAGYTARGLRKHIPAKGNLAGFVSFWVYPVLGTMITGALMLFVVGTPVAWINQGLLNWLESLSGANVIILGAIIGAMVASDLGGPINKAAYAFAIGCITEGNLLPYAIFASAKMTAPFAITMATIVKSKLFSEQEKEIGMQTWLLGLAGITEGAIPFMIEDPKCVVPSLVTGSAVTGAIVAAFNLGLSVPGAGIFSAILIESSHPLLMEALIWVGAAVIGAIISAIILVALKQRKNK